MGKNYDNIKLKFGKSFSWIQIKMVFKNSHSLFVFTSVLKNFTELTWKHLRSVTLIKRDSSTGAFLWILWNFKNPFLQNISWWLLLDFFQSINCFSATSFLSHFWWKKVEKYKCYGAIITYLHSCAVHFRDNKWYDNWKLYSRTQGAHQ